jgi:uncharacterized coiled-coil protein SlyX
MAEDLLRKLIADQQKTIDWLSTSLDRVFVRLKELEEMSGAQLAAISKLQSESAKTRSRVQDCELAVGLTMIAKQKPSEAPTERAILRDIKSTVTRSSQKLERILRTKKDVP